MALSLMKKWTHQHVSGNFTCHVYGREIDSVHAAMDKLAKAASTVVIECGQSGIGFPTIEAVNALRDALDGVRGES